MKIQDVLKAIGLEDQADFFAPTLASNIPDVNKARQLHMDISLGDTVAREINYKLGKFRF